jgi:hypothetical protein
MTRSEAMTRLQVLAQWQTHPTLSAPELEVCLSLAKCGDAAWDLNQAAQHAWLLKAGKSSDHHGTTVDGRKFEAQQVHANCMAMAQQFQKRIAGTLTAEVPDVE